MNTISEEFCPICGATIMATNSPTSRTCHFCGFRHVSRQDHSPTPCAKIAKDEINMTVLRLNNFLPDAAIYQEGFEGPFSPYQLALRNIDIVWSEGRLPYEHDLNSYFRDRARSLRPGGLIYLSTPVKNIWGKQVPLPGQINFFKSKNIMFLLERHGFKLQWRSPRYQKKLRLIARLQ